MNAFLPCFKPEDHYTWNAFITRQEKVVKKVACEEFITGLNANTVKGMRIIGAGILSSVGEISSIMDNNDMKIKPFDLIEIAKTSFDVTKKQPIYYILHSFEQLYNILNIDIDYLRRSVYGE